MAHRWLALHRPNASLFALTLLRELALRIGSPPNLHHSLAEMSRLQVEKKIHQAEEDKWRLDNKAELRMSSDSLIPSKQ